MNFEFEFRKGILFIRFIKKFNNKDYTAINTLINKVGIKHVVLNIDHLLMINDESVFNINKIYKNMKDNQGSLILCEKDKNISNKIFNYIPNINKETEVFNLI